MKADRSHLVFFASVALGSLIRTPPSPSNTSENRERISVLACKELYRHCDWRENRHLRCFHFFPRASRISLFRFLICIFSRIFQTLWSTISLIKFIQQPLVVSRIYPHSYFITRDQSIIRSYLAFRENLLFVPLIERTCLASYVSAISIFVPCSCQIRSFAFSCKNLLTLLAVLGFEISSMKRLLSMSCFWH